MARGDSGPGAPGIEMATNQALLADAFYLLRAEMGPFVEARVQYLDSLVYRQFVDEHPSCATSQ